MATRQFAIPLNGSSQQTGDITFKELTDMNATVKFKLSNASSGGVSDKLDLITKFGGSTKNHVFTLTYEGSFAYATLSAAQVADVYEDAEGGDWDYIEANWTVGTVDTPSGSILTIIVNDNSFSGFDWPPRT